MLNCPKKGGDAAWQQWLVHQPFGINSLEFQDLFLKKEQPIPVSVEDCGGLLRRGSLHKGTASQKAENIKERWRGDVK